jgi:hypothetical protein
LGFFRGGGRVAFWLGLVDCLFRVFLNFFVFNNDLENDLDGVLSSLELLSVESLGCWRVLNKGSYSPPPRTMQSSQTPNKLSTRINRVQSRIEYIAILFTTCAIAYSCIILETLPYGLFELRLNTRNSHMFR